MFANTFQSGFISVFYSVGSSPLSLWDTAVKNGHIRRVVDEEVKSLVLEISGTNVATTYVTCPIKPRASLGIKLPFLVMVLKNMKRYFTFEITVLDDKDMRRRFRVSNFQSTTKVKPFCTTMPIGLSDGWNQIQFNLADFTRRAYGSTYVETIRVQIHANVRVRRIYFSDRLYSDEEMPNEFKLFLPIPGTQRRDQKKGAKKSSKESISETKSEEKEGEKKEDEEGEEGDEKLPPTPIGEETEIKVDEPDEGDEEKGDEGDEGIEEEGDEGGEVMKSEPDERDMEEEEGGGGEPAGDEEGDEGAIVPEPSEAADEGATDAPPDTPAEQTDGEGEEGDEEA